MSHIIHKLDDDLIDKIAAGEVVERPASVVKELVENSLDAGATRITVVISDGGKKLIQVTDDGGGITPDQLQLAVSRHATSKIQKFEDLDTLHTCGFRGEALASIAAVSQFSLASKTKDSDAAEIIVHGGKFVDQRACAQPQGSCVTVKYLFYQTPARLKFLRTRETEADHIADAIIKISLGRPDVDFQLIHDDKDVLNLPRAINQGARALSLLGKDFENALYPFSAEEPGLKVCGILAHPQLSRPQRDKAYFFVNGRAVNDKILWHAVMEAHRDLLMKGRYPVLVLDLQVEAGGVDINVHPAKSEVRFAKSQAVHGFVYRTLRELLASAPWQSHGQNFGQNKQTQFHDGRPQGTAPTRSGIAETTQLWAEQTFSAPTPTDSFSKYSGQTQRSAPTEILPIKNDARFGKVRYSELQPIGQLLGTYILCETSNRLVLVDQHAAHERVGFEKLMQQFQRDGIPSEALLVAESFDLTPSEADLLKNYLDELQKFGFEVDFFGGNTFVVKAVPVLLRGKIKTSQLLSQIVSDIRETGKLTSLQDRLNLVLATMACHAQIRANHHLTLDEIRALLNELDEYQFTDFCPHGRPVCVEVQKEDIEKWFRRIV